MSVRVGTGFVVTFTHQGLRRFPFFRHYDSTPSGVFWLGLVWRLAVCSSGGDSTARFAFLMRTSSLTYLCYGRPHQTTPEKPASGVPEEHVYTYWASDPKFRPYRLDLQPTPQGRTTTLS